MVATQAIALGHLTVCADKSNIRENDISKDGMTSRDWALSGVPAYTHAP